MQIHGVPVPFNPMAVRFDEEPPFELFFLDVHGKAGNALDMAERLDGHVMGNGLQHGPGLRGIVLLGVGLADGLDGAEAFDVGAIRYLAFRLARTVYDHHFRYHIFHRFRHGCPGEIRFIADEKILYHLIISADHIQLPVRHVDVIPLAVLCRLVRQRLLDGIGR